MARVGGRSLWIAWPMGVICAGVVAALVWLAVPGVPGMVEFAGNMLRGATSAPSADGAGGASAAAEPASDCRSLYPDRLWADLTWTPDVLLSQSAAAPVTATALPAALAPVVHFTCTWRVSDAQRIATTVAGVAAGSTAIAEAALAADGFACTAAVDGVHCERERDGVREIHDIRGDVWLSSQLVGWEPEDYAGQTAARAF
jgi:hypothetical protein